MRKEQQTPHVGLHIIMPPLAARLDLFEQAVEIAFEQPILHDAVLLELTFCMGFGDFSGYPT